MSIDNTLRIVNKAQLATIFGKSLVTIDSWTSPSTPTVKDISRIDQAWETSDKRHYYVPCPHCKKTKFTNRT